MGTSCLQPEQVNEVYPVIINKCYQQIEKLYYGSNHSVQSLFYSKKIRPSMVKKGTVKKLGEYLSTHKHKLPPSIKYLLNFGLYVQILNSQAYLTTVLLVLEELTDHIQILTQQFQISKNKKKKNIFRKSSTSYNIGHETEKKIFLDTSALNFERYVILLFECFYQKQMAEDEKLSCLFSLNKFCEYKRFKFEKQTISKLSKLSLSLLQGCQISINQYKLCLKVIQKLLNRINEQTQMETLRQILFAILKFVEKYKNIIKSSSEINSQVSAICQIFGNLLKLNKYIVLYKVIIEILDSKIHEPQILFVFSYNHITLFILFNFLLLDSQANWQQVATLQNLNISDFIDLKDYPALTANKNLVFSMVIEYIRFGFENKKDMFVIPLRKLANSLLGNINRVNHTTWISEIKKLLKSIHSNIYQFVKEFINSINENYEKISGETLQISLLIILHQIKQRHNIELDIDIFEIIESKCLNYANFHLPLQINFEIVNQFLMFQEFFIKQDSQLFQSMVQELIKNYFRIMETEIEEHQMEGAYSGFVCFSKIFITIIDCYGLKNMFFIVLEKLIRLYSDNQVNKHCRYLYLEIIIPLCAALNIKLANNLQEYYQLEKQLKFMSAVQNSQSNLNISAKIKLFQHLQLDIGDQIRSHTAFSLTEYENYINLIDRKMLKFTKTLKEQQQQHSLRISSSKQGSIYETSFVEIINKLKHL